MNNTSDNLEGMVPNLFGSDGKAVETQLIPKEQSEVKSDHSALHGEGLNIGSSQKSGPMSTSIEIGVESNDASLSVLSNAKVDVAYIPHVGWLQHDIGEEVVHLLRQGHYEAAEQAFFWLYLRTGDAFIDCGAHIGLYSVLASKVTGGEAHIVAVEANRYTAKNLILNLKSNCVENVTIIESAIWNSEGYIRFIAGGIGEAAYDHVDFDNFSSGKDISVPTTTLDKVVEGLGKGKVELVKIDVEGAESEAILGGKDAISAGKLPVLMVEFTENNLLRRGLDTACLYRQLEELGYTLCEFKTERLQLVPYRPGGPIWYKNLFACQDVGFVNMRLATACEVNRKIALDIIGRFAACSQFKALEELDNYKKLAGQSTDLREWAQRSDAALVAERENSGKLRDWAEQAEATLVVAREEIGLLRESIAKAERALVDELESEEKLRRCVEDIGSMLASERETTKQLTQWAERSDASLVAEREITGQLRQWVENIELLLASERVNVKQVQEALLSERETTKQLTQWAERSDASLAAEREVTGQLRQWVENIETLLASERDNAKQIDLVLAAQREEAGQLRQWVENIESLLTRERENAKRVETLLLSERETTKQLTQWAERSDASLAAEREVTGQLRQWVENIETLLASERDNAKQVETLLLSERETTKQLTQWAERSDASLAAEREVTGQLRQWVKNIETLLASERDNAKQVETLLLSERETTKQLTQWAERSDASLAAEREVTGQLRQWVKNIETLLASERDNAKQVETLLLSERETTKQLTQWAERSDASLAAEREVTGQLRGRIAQLDSLNLSTLEKVAQQQEILQSKWKMVKKIIQKK